MALYKLNVNGKTSSVEADSDMPLLWAIRDLLHLPGTKYGCGIGQCGACTVLIDGVATKSCQQAVGDLGNAKITTIEGLSTTGLHPLQEAWIEHDVSQCGFCQTGQIMAAAGLLKKKPKPSDQEIRDAMNGNLCRCGTYVRIFEAVQSVAKGAK